MGKSVDQIKKVLHYDFTEVNSTIIGDVSGNGMAGVVRGYDAEGMRFFRESIYGVERECIALPGGNKGGYIELPAGVLQQNEGITISFWCRLHQAARGDKLLALGRDQALYVRILTVSEAAEALEKEISGDGYVLVPCITSGGTSQEWPVWNEVVLQKDRWYMITMTLDKETESYLRYYVDARFAAEQKNRRMAARMLYEADQCFFGRGLAGTTPVQVDYADIQIYNEVLEADQIDGMYQVEDAARIKMDVLQLVMPEVIQSDLKLETMGSYGSRITWNSDCPTVINEEGIVNRPKAGCGDAIVRLTASFSCGKECRQYVYTVTVKALPTAREIAEHDAQMLEIPGYHHIYKDLSLPMQGEWGSVITYESSDPAIVDITGKVCRPSNYRVPVVLKAYVTCEDIVVEKELPLVVVPVYKKAGSVVKTVDKISRIYEGMDSADKRLQIQGNRWPLGSIIMNGTHIYTENRNRDLEYLRLLDADRMLYNFRSAFGQDTCGAKPLGGWDEPMGLLRGHSTGHFLSALAYAYAGTGDMQLKEKLDYLVSELRKLQKLSKGDPAAFRTVCTPNHASQRLWSRDPSTWGEGFLSAYSPDQFALLEQYTPYATIWAPYYTLHKILAGFLDAYMYASSEMALEAACGIGDWVALRLASLTAEQRSKMWGMYIAGEYGGMNESMSTLYLLTGKCLYRDAAAMFDNPGFFEGLAEGKDTIAGRHANQHIPQIIGALQEYKATGEERYYRIAYNFWRMVTSGYTYAIGGVGRGEMFKEAGILAGNIEGTTNCETCAAYNMLKLTQELYRYDPSCVEYMDYYERTQLNQIAASQTPHVTRFRHNGVTYMLPIGPGAHRRYSTDYDDFSCCHGTGMENHVKYQENIYYQTPEAVYVNLYVPSELQLDAGRLVLSGVFPGEKMNLRAEGVDVTVRLRVPYWCKSLFAVGTEKAVIPIDEGTGYVEVFLKTGESVDISLPYTVHLDSTPDLLDGSKVASVMYGPLVMVALCEDTQWQELLVGPDLAEDFAVNWEDGKPRLDYFGLRFVPMYEAHEVGYHTYLKIKEV